MASPTQNLQRPLPLTPPASLQQISQQQPIKRIKLVLTRTPNFPLQHSVSVTPIVSSLPPVPILSHFLPEPSVISPPSVTVSPAIITQNSNTANIQRTLNVNISRIGERFDRIPNVRASHVHNNHPITLQIIDNNLQNTDSLECSPREIFISIMSRYLQSIKTINTLFEKIVSIPDGEFILLNDFMKSIATNIRPGPEIRNQIIISLQNARIISYTTASKNSVKIRKGPIFL